MGGQAYEGIVLSNKGYSESEAQADVGALIDLVAYFNQQEEPSTEESKQIELLANNLQSTIPSSPSQPYSPPMRRTEQLPGISSLSAEISSIQAQLFSAPVKKQYPSYSSASQRVPEPVVLSSMPHLPSLPRTPAPQQSKPSRVNFSPEPESSPCPSPPLSPKRSKKNFTKVFNLRFHDLLNNNDHASSEWHLYAQRHKNRCTIKRAPCIKVSRGFCASYGQEFTELAKEEKFGALGTRTECGCMHKPQPLVSGSGPSKKQRQSTRSAPYPAQAQTRSPSTPQEPELPSTPAADPPSSPLVCPSTSSFFDFSIPFVLILIIFCRRNKHGCPSSSSQLLFSTRASTHSWVACSALRAMRTARWRAATRSLRISCASPSLARRTDAQARCSSTNSTTTLQ